MKTSVNWLAEYVAIPWEPPELAERLTLAGLEVEGIETLGALPEGVVVGRILERRKHPNADRLSICRVDVGGDEPIEVVCGAPNCNAGVLSVFAPVGTILADGTKLRKAKIRGVVSRGMLCAEDELGLGEDHSGIIELPDQARPGEPAARYFQADTVIDWEVTPNRPDWLSHVGIAREIAAVADAPESFHLPKFSLSPSPAANRVQELTAVEVRAPDLCPRYTARVIRGVRIGPSPEWLRRRLEAVGIRPINNVVDITNFVMMECGQPLHAFDMELLAGRRIVVRRAEHGEIMVTLDGAEHRLAPEDLVIADAEKAVALAGVMGGLNSEIRDQTTDVLLESAAFLPAAIRATAKRLGVHTEASYRFERGVGFDMVEFASARAAALIAELAGGELAQGVVDVFPGRPSQPARVRCRFRKVRQLLGIEIDDESIQRCFVRLGLEIARRDDRGVDVEVPAFRLDLQREADLIEEVARIHGLENIPEVPEPAALGGPRSADRYYPVERIRAELRALGLDEALNYSLISLEAAVRRTGVSPEQVIRLANPLSRELACVRPSLLPGLLDTVARNVAHRNLDLALFEIGRVLVHQPDVPEERLQAGIVLTGRMHPERFGEEREKIADFYDLKGLLEGWFETTGIRGIRCTAVSAPAFADGSCAAMDAADGTRLAVFGRVTDELTADIRLPHPLFLALVEVGAMLRLPRPEKIARDLPQFPSTSRDISFVAPNEITHQDVLDAIRAFKNPWIEKIELFDVFEDPDSLGSGQRSLAYSIVYRDSGRTLTDEEVNRAHERLRRHLADSLPIQLR